MMDNDPRIVTLQKDLSQAQQTIEKLIEETVPQEKYQKLQQQLKNINASESQAFDGWQRAEEKVKKVTHRLDTIMNQMDTLCSLYIYVLVCRKPTRNYALFWMERYLQLKIKVVKVGVSIEIKTIDDFINCCKHYEVKVQKLLCEFYLLNLVLDGETEKNPSHFVGDIQLQAFISFAVNQIKWLKAYNIFERQENGLDLWVRGEPRNPLQLWNKHRSLFFGEVA